MLSTALDSRLPSIRDLSGPGIGHIDRIKLVSLVHAFWLATLIAAGLSSPAASIDMAAVVYPLCLIYASSVAWILGSWFWLRGSIFEPYGLFVVAASLFNGGQAFLEIVGLNNKGMLDGRFSAEALAGSLYLVTVSLLTIHGGALAAFAHLKPHCRKRLSADRASTTRAAGWMMLVISAVPTVVLFRNYVTIVVEHGYMELFRQENSMGLLWALSGLLVPGLIFLTAGSRNHRGVRYFSLGVAALYAGTCLFLGERAAVVMSCVSIAWVFDRTARRIPRWILTVVAVSTLIVFAAVKETRQQAGVSRFSLQQQSETLANLRDPISYSIAEMGETQSITAHAIGLVPAARDFDLGMSYLYGISAIIPNVGWEVHPSVAHGLLCDWITRTVEPVVADAGGGLGFSLVAEAYINFGWVGGPLFLGIVGYGLCRLFFCADSGDPAKLALVASFLSVFLVIARGESAIVMRGLVWYSGLPYLLTSALTASSNRRNR